MKPSVTDLLKLLDKPALLNWANKIGLEGININDYRKKSMAGGSSIHYQIEMYIKHKRPFDSQETMDRFNSFFDGKTIIEIEKPIETEYFKGRMDVSILVDGKKYICDFKSNQKGVYLENKLQLTAYRMAENCDIVGIISVPDFTFIPVNITDFEPYEKILKSLSEIYKYKKIIDNGN
mgnify:CR=1 FL=1